MTGDGVPDLLSLADDHYLLYAGPMAPPYPESPEGASHGWDSHDCIIQMQLDAGDLDADGSNDVLLPVTDCSDGDGVYVAWGPIPTDGVYEDIWDVATFWTTAPDESWLWGDGVGAGEDLDGDGAAEVVAYSDSDGASAGMEIAVLFGSRADTPESVSIEPVIGYAHDFLLTPDMDGDGLGELILWWWDGEHPLWIAGGDLRSADGAYVVDLAAGELDTPIYAPYGAETAMPWCNMPVADWDADGLPDLLWASYSDDDDTIGVRHFTTLTRGTNSAIGELRTSSVYGFTTTLGRDRDELLVTDDDGGAWHVLDLAPLTSSVDIEELPQLSVECPTSRGYCSKPRFHEDLTGDGLADGVVTTRNEDDSYTIMLLPGFDIPWEDPWYW